MSFYLNMLLGVWLSVVSFFENSYETLSQYLFTSVIQEELIDTASALKKVGVQRQSSYMGRIRESEKLIEHEYYGEAGIELALAIKEKPTLLKPLLLLGEIYIRQKDSVKLQALIQQLKQKFPNRSQVSVLEARSLLLKNDFQAVKNFIYAQKDPAPRLKFYQAVLFALQNNHTKAQSILSELNTLPVQPYALKVGKTGVEEVENMNTILSMKLSSVIKGLLSQYDSFYKFSDGKNAHLFALLGKELGDIDETVLARSFADVSVKEDPSYIDAWILRGYSYFLEKKFETALADFRQAYRLDPVRPQTHYFMALTLTELGRNADAIFFFEKALKHGFEFSEDIDWKLLDLFIKEEKFEKVVVLYKNLIDGTVEQKKISSAFHILIDKADRPDVALEIAEKLIIEKMGNIFYMNMYAWALMANENYEKAQGILEEADKIVPEHPQTYLNLGLLYELQKNYEKAKEFYKKSYEYGKESVDSVSLVNFAAKKFNEIDEKYK